MAGQMGWTPSRQHSGPSGARSRRGFNPPGCTACLGTKIASPPGCSGLKDGDANGLIVKLPAKCKVPRQSCAYTNADFNDGAFKHPCLIIDTSPCGHLVFCLQVTSFGGRTIQEKYSGCSNLRENSPCNDYVAFKESGTVAHNEQTLLEYSGPRMEEQSYVHLEFPFWIEREYLHHWDNRIVQPNPLSLIVDLFELAEYRRRVFGAKSTLRLANPKHRQNGSVSPPLSSSPVLAPIVNGRSVPRQTVRSSSLGKRDFGTFDADSQQSASGRTMISPQRPPAHEMVSWRPNDQNSPPARDRFTWRPNNQKSPPANEKLLRMQGNWRDRGPVAQRVI